MLPLSLIENETAQPGYYSVFLDRYKVKAELTATRRAAIHRYTFPKAEDAGFILDLDYSLQRQTNEEIELEVISDTKIHTVYCCASVPSFPSVSKQNGFCLCLNMHKLFC